MERITQTQAMNLPSVDPIGQHTWNLNGLKQCCPFILTTGIHEGKPFATTQYGKVSKYQYGESELDAAFKLVAKQYQAGLYNGSFGFKIRVKYSNAPSETIRAARQLL